MKLRENLPTPLFLDQLPISVNFEKHPPPFGKGGPSYETLGVILEKRLKDLEKSPPKLGLSC